MANLTDAKLLYLTWARHFDPSAPPFEGLSSATQEAWLLVAAAARMLDQQPEPPPLVLPGLHYIARWTERDGWHGATPRRPALCFTLNNNHFAIMEAPNEIPIVVKVERPPSEMRKIGGMIYDYPPIY